MGVRGGALLLLLLAAAAAAGIPVVREWWSYAWRDDADV
jgi:hypothetical protein